MPEGIDGQFNPLVSPPFPESQDAVFRGATLRESRWFRRRGQNAVHSHMDIPATIFLAEDVAICRHQDRHGVRHQQHFGGHRTRGPIEPGPSHTRIFQVHNIHQVVQGDVSVRTSQSGQQWRGKPGKGNHRLVAKRGEQQVEPDHVGLQFTNCAGDVGAAAEVTERPAANDRELLEFWLRRVQAVRKHGQANERVLLQLTRNVKTVFAQTSPARRKCTDKTDLHGPLRRLSLVSM